MMLIATRHLASRHKRSARFGLGVLGPSANLCSLEASNCPVLHVLDVDAPVEARSMEPATWSILAPPNTDPVGSVATDCLLLLSSSWVWLATRLSKTPSSLCTTNAPVRPNRNWRALRTKITHVTPPKGGCNIAVAFCVAVSKKMTHQRCTPGARVVHTNHTPFFEVSAC